MFSRMQSIVAPLAGLLVAAAGPNATTTAPGTASPGTGTASAGQQAPGERARGEAPADQHSGRSWVMGNVIASKANSVSINTENGSMLTLQIDPRTDVTVNGKKTSPKDLKLSPGADVFAAYEGGGQHPMAIVLKVDETGRELHSRSKAESTSSPSRAP